jgi:hypothetical protein
MKKILLIFYLFLSISCNDLEEKKVPNKPTYVAPSINYKGQFRKGGVRKSVSTNPNAIRNQARSKYYYETRGKYRKRK